ncbi:MAG: DUF934 domain-containing protein [Allorhizobium sp.]
MTRIWTQAGFAGNDPWIVETEETKAGDGQRPVIGLADFLSRVEASNEGGYGVLIAPSDDVTALSPHLDRIDLVAVAFPAFNDGRAFSHAALLRNRLGFTGEVRAVGDVLIDQIPLMLRTGISSFAVTNAVALARLGEGRLPGIAEHYQPAEIDGEVLSSYSWRRMTVSLSEA